RRKDSGEGLKQLNLQKDLPTSHAQGLARLDLTSRDRLQACPYDLGGIGPYVDRKCDQRSSVRIQAQSKPWQPKENEKSLNKQRGISDELDIERHKPP